MKKAKLFAATACILTMTMLSAACSGGGGNVPPASSNNTVSEQVSKPPAAEVEIIVWDKPHADDANRVFREQQFAIFDERYPHIKVTHVEQTKEKEREQFMTAVAGGQQPDVYAVAYPDMENYIS